MGSSPIGSTNEVLLGIEGAHLKHKLPKVNESVD